MSTTSGVGGALPPREHVPSSAQEPSDLQQHGTVRPITPPPGGTAAEEAAGATTASLRASDAERTETVDRLHQALAAGRLDLAETDERVAAAYAARHRHELSALLTDLPVTDTAFTVAPSWAALWMLVVWRARTLLTGNPAIGRPTTRQLRGAALLAALTAVWVVACAVLGAVVVGA